MNATMHKLNGNPKLSAAIERCRKAHPRAVRLAADKVRVWGSTGNTYTVTLAAPKSGLLLAACDCKAGQAGYVCLHLAAAAVCPGTVATSIVSPVMARDAGMETARREPVFVGSTPTPAPHASPTEAPASIPAGTHAHTHKCTGCKAEIKCDFPYCGTMGDAIFCHVCYGAGRRIGDDIVPSVYPVTITNGQSARAC